jgi:hypothetical protein
MKFVNPNFTISNVCPSLFPSPPAYRQAGAGEREGVRGKFECVCLGFWIPFGI